MINLNLVLLFLVIVQVSQLDHPAFQRSVSH